MFARFLMITAMLFVVTACSSTEEEVMMDEQVVPTTQRETISGGTAGDDIYGQNLNNNGPMPGTQEELVATIGDRVFFGYDRYDLSAEARSVLDAQASWLMKYPNLTVTIGGHADERGTREYNLALGERRANSVKNYLVAYGVDPRRVKTISYGKERPSALGANESAWAQNRRSVTKVD